MNSFEKTCVWGSSTTIRGEVKRVIVKSRTKKHAMELLNSSGAIKQRVTVGEFKKYWSQTSNVVEISVTANVEEGVWSATGRGPRIVSDYVRTEEGRS